MTTTPPPNRRKLIMKFGAKQKKTVAAQREHTAEQHPVVQLVPDKAAEQHPKATQISCMATRWLAGSEVECDLDLLHAGDHAWHGYTWRRRSGDDD